MNFLQYSWFLLKLSRPIFWIGCLFLFFFGVLYSGSEFNSLFYIYLAVLSFPVNFFICALNDVYDYESDKLNPRKNSIQGLVLEKKYHKPIMRFVFLFSGLFILVSYFINLYVFLISIFMVVASFMYSVPPVRLKTRPPFDSLFNGVCYTLFFVLGLIFNGSLIFPWKIIFSLVISLSALHIFFALLDIEVDRKVGDVTFAVKYGRKISTYVSSFSLFSLFFIKPFSPSYLNLFFIFFSIFVFTSLFFNMKTYKKYSIYLYAIAVLFFFSYFIS